jgi:hypothetical protein
MYNQTPRKVSERHTELVGQYQANVASAEKLRTTLAVEARANALLEMTHEDSDEALKEIIIGILRDRQPDPVNLAVYSDLRNIAMQKLYESSKRAPDDASVGVVNEKRAQYAKYDRITYEAAISYSSDIDSELIPGLQELLPELATNARECAQVLEAGGTVEEYEEEAQGTLLKLKDYAEKNTKQLYLAALAEAALDGVQINHPDAAKTEE